MCPAPYPDGDPLYAHFSGKRRFTRVPCVRKARALGPNHDYTARVIDISPGGVLLQMLDPAFYRKGDEERHGLALVERAFPEGLKLEFPSEGVVVPVEVVRITPHAEELICIGCRFVRQLTEVECVLLGVTWSQTRRRDDDLPRVAVAGARVTLLLFGGGQEVLGPRCVVPVLATEPRRIIASLPNGRTEARRLAETLAGSRLHAILVRGRRHLWEGGAQLLACHIESEEDTATVHLRTDEPLNGSVRRHFRAEVLDEPGESPSQLRRIGAR